MAAFNAVRGPNEALEKAYAMGDLELIGKLTSGILESVCTYSALVRGTDVEVPQSALDLVVSSLEAARSGNLQRAKALFDAISESGGADLDMRLEARAREAQRASPGTGSKTNAIPQ